jgi:pimeloyl-ACP methyl ester carboxylesterase
MSGPCREDHGLAVEIDDLRALLNESQARRVFGLSSGAVIAMEAALRIPEIERLAVYEPPFEFDDVVQRAWVPRYERALARGDLVSALAAVLKGPADRGVMPLIPRVLLVPFFRLGIRASSRAPKAPGVVSPLDLIPTIHFDAITVGEAAGPIERFRTLGCDVLLLGGSRSNRNLQAAVDGLAKVLPDARRVPFPGVGHTAADDTKQPEVVAKELLNFFR